MTHDPNCLYTVIIHVFGLWLLASLIITAALLTAMDPQPHFIIYCLHDLYRSGAPAHYIGRCRVDQFRRRIQDHYGGRGARATETAIAEGSAWVLTTWLETDDSGSEYNPSTRASLIARCSICSHRDGQIAGETVSIV